MKYKNVVASTHKTATDHNENSIIEYKLDLNYTIKACNFSVSLICSIWKLNFCQS